MNRWTLYNMYTWKKTGENRKLEEERNPMEYGGSMWLFYWNCHAIISPRCFSIAWRGEGRLLKLAFHDTVN